MTSRQIIYHRDLFLNLVMREVRVHYRRSALGILWSLLNPLVSLLIFIFLFRSVLHLGIPNYPTYVFSGLLAWNWFSGSMLASTYAILQNRDLVRKPAFPTEMLIIVSVAAKLVDFLMSIPVLILVMFLGHVRPGPLLLLFPLLLLAQFLFTCGLCFVLSIANVYFRDVEHIVGILMGIWFYLTPIFYQAGGVAQRYHLVFDLNPMAQLVNAYRAIFLTNSLPDLLPFSSFVLLAMLVFAGGALFFGHWKADILDEF